MTTQSSNIHAVDSQMAQQFYINGGWCSPATPASSPVVNPATESVVAEVASGSAADVDRAVAAARAAFPHRSATSAETRASLLGKIYDLILERKESLRRRSLWKWVLPSAMKRLVETERSPIGRVRQVTGVICP